MNRILLIDDEEGIHDLWKTLHDVADPTFCGECKMDMAKTLDEGMAKIGNIKYDVVILDLALPPLSKDEVIQWLLENAKTLPPVVAFTGSEDVNTRMRCINAGAAQFFTKTDAIKFPNLFFKILYNEHLKRTYASHSTI